MERPSNDWFLHCFVLFWFFLGHQAKKHATQCWKTSASFLGNLLMENKFSNDDITVIYF